MEHNALPPPPRGFPPPPRAPEPMQPARADNDFFEWCKDLHDKQYRWAPHWRLGWWAVLLPVATWCWASTLRSGPPRQAGLAFAGFLALVFTLIAVADQQPSTTQAIAADEGSVTSNSVTTAASDASTTSRESTSLKVQAFAAVADTAATADLPSAETLEPAPPTLKASTSTTAAATSQPPTTTAPTTRAPTTAAPTTAAPTTTAPTTTAAPSTQPPTTATTTQPPTTSTPATAAPTVASTAAPTTAAPVSDCHPAYGGCIPYAPGDAYNCGQLSPSQKPVHVKEIGNDPYRLDADSDGVGCEAG